MSSRMQDPTMFQPIKPQFQEQEQLKCPRCDSSNTKFCYYNNYNLAQPRHFCKNCKRYWTKGGSLRNIPIGGGSRKNTKRSSSGSKRSSSASNSSSSTLSSSPTPAAAQSQDPQQNPIRVYPKVDHQETPMIDISGSFSSLLTSNDQFGSLVEGLNPDGSGLKLMQMGGFGENVVDASGHGLNSDPGLQVQSNENNNPESFMGLHNGDSNCWNGNNGWPDLAIYTPGSSFQ